MQSTTFVLSFSATLLMSFHPSLPQRSQKCAYPHCVPYPILPSFSYWFYLHPLFVHHFMHFCMHLFPAPSILLLLVTFQMLPVVYNILFLHCPPICLWSLSAVCISRFFIMSYCFPRRSSSFSLKANFCSYSILCLLISLWFLQSSVTVHASQITELLYLFNSYFIYVDCHLASFLSACPHHSCFLQIDLHSIFRCFLWIVRVNYLKAYTLLFATIASSHHLRNGKNCSKSKMAAAT